MQNIASTIKLLMVAVKTNYLLVIEANLCHHHLLCTALFKVDTVHILYTKFSK